MLHNAYQLRGGEDVSFEAERRMLRDAGHRVETIELTNDSVPEIGIWKVAQQAIWSQPSFDLVDQTLRSSQFDVLHVQNFFPLLSPSVYYAARKHRVPVVQTLRNYRLLCPSAFLFREGRPCEDCLHKTIKYPSVLHKCYRNSSAGSAVVAAMVGIHTVKGTWRNAVDLFICLTEFAREKFLSAGFPASKLIVKSNFVYPDSGPGQGSEGYALFVGRLSTEKGLLTLLSAWEKVQSTRTLKIVGEGPLMGPVQAACERNDSIQLLGARSATEVGALMGKASVLIFPSEWYETFGRVAIESFAKGTPVVASRLGAMAELIQDGYTGLLFEPRNPEDLAMKLQWLFDNSDKLTEMRGAARLEYETKYTAEKNLTVLLDAYRQAEQISKRS
jgi:glycosyltransferase involved in cell wall biosynthesis